MLRDKTENARIKTFVGNKREMKRKKNSKSNE